MKKMTKTFGVVAASAALALGCAMPAFAAEGSVSVETQNFVGTSTDGTSDDLEGSTQVNLYGYDESTQIVATVPVSLTVAAPAAGGAIIPPTSGTYAITNGGELGIKVTNIKGTEEAGWKLLASVPSSRNSYNNMALNIKNMGTLVPVTTSGSAVSSDFTAAAKNDKIEMDLSGSALPKTGADFAEDATPAVKVIYTVAAV